MTKSLEKVLVGTIGLAALVAGCERDTNEPAPPNSPAARAQRNTTSTATSASAGSSVEVPAAKLAAYQPLPEVMKSEDNPITAEKVELGKKLYYDARMSKNHDVSCNTCHDLAKYGVDNLKVSVGHKKQAGTRNSPTVYNAAGHFVQFWDGRSPNVEHQATQPVLNPVEMAHSDKAVVKTLKSIPEYVTAFEKAFPEAKEPVTFENFGKAIGAFERKLTTPSRWDQFLKGDNSALTDDEKKGFLAFDAAGCQTCHNGAYLGGSTFQRLGAVKPWPNQKDQGRFEVTKSAADKMSFKVPSLRNVEKTAPYFHDASAATLEEAVKMMAEHQLGKQLEDEQVKLIVAWLGSLTGDLPKELIEKPELPESTATTPKPDPS